MNEITYFSDIYCLNGYIVKDKNMCSTPPYLHFKKKWGYLQYSISYFQYDCLKDLYDYEPFYLQTYKFISNGEDVSLELYPIPDKEDFNVGIVFYDNEEESFIELPNNEYVFNYETNIVTLNNPIQEDVEIRVSAYADGYFNSELDFDEKTILAEGMTVPYLEANRNTPQVLQQILYGGSNKMYSQAEMQKQLNNSISSQQQYVETRIINYSFRAQKELRGQSKLTKLSSGGNKSARYSKRSGRF